MLHMPFGVTPTPGGSQLAANRGVDVGWRQGGWPDLGPGFGASWAVGHIGQPGTANRPCGFCPNGCYVGGGWPTTGWPPAPLASARIHGGNAAPAVPLAPWFKALQRWCKFGCGRPRLWRIGPEFNSVGPPRPTLKCAAFMLPIGQGGGADSPVPGLRAHGTPHSHCAHGIPSRFRHLLGPRSPAFAAPFMKTAAASAPVELELEVAERVEHRGRKHRVPGGGAACVGPGPMTDIPGTGLRY